MKRSAIITGVNGQDGSWLSSRLLDLDYDVYGMVRRSATDKLWRLRHLGVLDNPNFHLVSGDMTDPASLNSLMEKYRPDECYNLAAQSFVGESFNSPISTCEITGMGVLNLLEAIRMHSPKTKFYQAGSSEQFGYDDWPAGMPMSEKTPFHPRSPYGCAKAFAHHVVQNYREAYGIFGCVGLLFNHESELRGEEFVTAKICKGAAEIYLGKRDSLALGNLEAKRDWGYAPDYVEGMRLMLQQDDPNDYVLATGKVHSIRDFCEAAFMHFGLPYENFVYTDDKFCRPTDVNYLLGDSTRALVSLNWMPKVLLQSMVEKMCDFWLNKISSRSMG